jgi:hypothetical protein
MVRVKDGRELRYELTIVEVHPVTKRPKEAYVSHIPLMDNEQALAKWAIENIGKLEKC